MIFLLGLLLAQVPQTVTKAGTAAPNAVTVQGSASGVALPVTVSGSASAAQAVYFTNETTNATGATTDNRTVQGYHHVLHVALSSGSVDVTWQYSTDAATWTSYGTNSIYPGDARIMRYGYYPYTRWILTNNSTSLSAVYQRSQQMPTSAYAASVPGFYAIGSSAVPIYADGNGVQSTKISDGTDVADVTAANALKVDGSAVTQPISTPTPIDAAGATYSTANYFNAITVSTTGATIDNRTTRATVHRLFMTLSSGSGWVTPRMEVSADGSTWYSVRGGSSGSSGPSDTTVYATNGLTYTTVRFGYYPYIRWVAGSLSSTTFSATATGGHGPPTTNFEETNKSGMIAMGWSSDGGYPVSLKAQTTGTLYTTPGYSDSGGYWASRLDALNATSWSYPIQDKYGTLNPGAATLYVSTDGAATLTAIMQGRNSLSNGEGDWEQIPFRVGPTGVARMSHSIAVGSTTNYQYYPIVPPGMNVIRLKCSAYTSGFLWSQFQVAANSFGQMQFGPGPRLLTPPVVAAQDPTYAFAATVAPAATATDVFTLTGSASKTIRIRKIVLSGTQTTAGNVVTSITKRSTANSGGTSTGLTEVPLDSSDAAATATGLSYTVNPTTGTLVGDVDMRSVHIPTALTEAVPTEWEFGVPGRRELVLRGTGEVVAINLGGATLTGGSLTATFEWTEE